MARAVDRDDRGALTTRELGGKRLHAAFAALLIVTIPVAALQASNSKNDLVVAGGVAVLSWLGARTWADRRFPLSRALEAGAVLGLLVLTKGTGLIFGGILGIYIACAALRAIAGTGFMRVASRVALIVLLMLVINGPHWTRNTVVFGGPVSSPKGDWGLRNEIRTPAAIASNLIRNFAIELPLPWEDWNAALRRIDHKCHQWLGIKPNDPRITFAGCPAGPKHLWFGSNDDAAGAPVQVMACMLAVGLLIRKSWRVAVQMAMAVALLVAICVVLKWQVWHTRFHTSVLVAAIPVVAVVWTHSVARLAIAMSAVALVGYGVTYHTRRSLVSDPPFYQLSRLEISMLGTKPGLLGETRAMLAAVENRRPGSVAIHSGIGAPLYPLMMAVESLPCKPKVIQFRWDNLFPRAARQGLPDLVVLLYTKTPFFVDVASNTVYRLQENIGDYRIYARAK